MTLENMLRKKLAEPGAAPPEAVLSHRGWTVTIQPEAQDSLSCAVKELTLQRAEPVAGGDVRAWAERIAGRVTGLLEPLKIHEVDAGRHVALLRSAAPTQRDPGLHYYEVELHGTDRAAVRRYRGFREAGHKREQTSFVLPYETLAKLIDDCIADR
jgi:hypothetical protein